METETLRIADIYHYLENTPESCHTIIDKYNGMRLTDFIKQFRWFNIKYPYKDDRKQFLIELQEEDCIITCKMVNNICVGAYSIEND